MRLAMPPSSAIFSAMAGLAEMLRRTAMTCSSTWSLVDDMSVMSSRTPSPSPIFALHHLFTCQYLSFGPASKYFCTSREARVYRLATPHDRLRTAPATCSTICTASPVSICTLELVKLVNLAPARCGSRGERRARAAPPPTPACRRFRR